MMTPQEEQVKWQQDASNSVKRNAFYMKRATDEDNLREALRFSAAMLGELRTSLLSPQKYFELYMQAFDELRHLEVFFKEEHRKGRSYTDLYELVQHAGNVLPRLYLLCTVGACYIRSQEAHSRDILRDLVEMCKGVQHPTRGLFLRSYLCQVSRGLLPDVGTPYEGEGGTIVDALEFLLINFTEMNKLWVRMQHQGSSHDRERREKERQQLADLVGKNLTYISQLEGLDFKLYKEIVQPRTMEQILSCKDDIAQQYLMQCIIQGFPDECHLGTLGALLAALPELQAGVRVHLILASLLDRLARYAKADPSVIKTIDELSAFQQLQEAAAKVAERHAEMPSADVVAMYIALAHFSGGVYPDKLDHINSVLASCHKALAAKGDLGTAGSVKQLVALLSIPLGTHDPVTILGLSAYPDLLGLLAPPTQKEMAVKLVQQILASGTEVGSTERVAMLLTFIAPLTTDRAAPPPGDAAPSEDDDEDFEEQQLLIARLIHLLRSDDPQTHFDLLRATRDGLAKGGPRRLRYSLPPIAFCAFDVVRRLAAQGASPNGESPEGTDSSKATTFTVLQFVHGCADLLAQSPNCAEMALQLFLTAAQSASQSARLELIAYELFEQAFMLYEEGIPDSAAEKTALASIVGALQACRVFPPENRASLVHKATGYSAKLLRKPDQCRAVLACSHLFWQTEPPPPESKPEAGKEADVREEKAEEAAETPEAASESTASPSTAAADTGQLQPLVRDGEHVMVCLKRALKIAHAAQQQLAVALRSGDTTPAWLFVEILNHYLYYYDQGLSSISPSVLQNLLELVGNEMAGGNCQQDAPLVAFHANTLAHIATCQAKGGPLAHKYDMVKL